MTSMNIEFVSEPHSGWVAIRTGKNELLVNTAMLATTMAPFRLLDAVARMVVPEQEIDCTLGHIVPNI